MWDFWSLHAGVAASGDDPVLGSRHPRRLSPHGRLRQPHLQHDQRAGRALLGEVPLQDRSRASRNLSPARGRASWPAPIRITRSATCSRPSSAATSRAGRCSIQVMPEAEAAPLHGQSVRPHQGLAARGLPAHRGRRARARIATPRTTSPTSSRRRSRRRRSCRASASRPTTCCRADCSPTPTRIAIGWASTTTRSRSTGRINDGAHTITATARMRIDGNGGGGQNYHPNSFDGVGDAGRRRRAAVHAVSGAVERATTIAATTTTTRRRATLYRLMNGEQRTAPRATTSSAR